MKMKRIISVLLTAALVSTLFAGVGSASETEEMTEESSTETAEPVESEDEVEDADGREYPTWEINGVIPWGAGGQTDNLMRPLAYLAQVELGQNINLWNMPGDTGALGMEYVYDQEADGYTILLSAENPPLYQALGISDLSYDDFECILLLGDETTCLIVPADSPYTSLTDLVNAALSGETLTLASTGPGGIPWTVAAMISGITGAEFQTEEYDGDATAISAVQGGECDFTICTIGVCHDKCESGDVQMLCVFADEPSSLAADVPVVTDEYPEFEEYLPWGPYRGVFVKEGTDSEIVAMLTDAFMTAFEDEDYQKRLENNEFNVLGYTGEEADTYISEWGERTLSALESAGVTG